MALPEPIVSLTAALSKLPGVGPRSAERIALHLVQTESALVQHLAGLVDGLDVASGGELTVALDTGKDPAHISFAGPGKSEAELTRAVAAGVHLHMERRVGLGSVCRRQATAEIGDIVKAMADEGLRLHGFGVKAAGIAGERSGQLRDQRGFPGAVGPYQCVHFAAQYGEADVVGCNQAAELLDQALYGEQCVSHARPLCG